MATIDHLILSVNDVAASVDFYVNILGFEHAGKEGPFTVSCGILSHCIKRKSETNSKPVLRTICL